MMVRGQPFYRDPSHGGLPFAQMAHMALPYGCYVAKNNCHQNMLMTCVFVGPFAQAHSLPHNIWLPHHAMNIATLLPQAATQGHQGSLHVLHVHQVVEAGCGQLLVGKGC